MAELTAAVEQHLRDGATDAEKLSHTFAFLRRIDVSVVLVLPETRKEGGTRRKYVRLIPEGEKVTGAWVYPYGRVGLRLEHSEVRDFHQHPAVHLVDTVTGCNVDVRLEDTDAIPVALELLRRSMKKITG
jgi:hypothetical protein